MRERLRIAFADASAGTASPGNLEELATEALNVTAAHRHDPEALVLTVDARVARAYAVTRAAETPVGTALRAIADLDEAFGLVASAAAAQASVSRRVRIWEAFGTALSLRTRLYFDLERSMPTAGYAWRAWSALQSVRAEALGQVSDSPVTGPTLELLCLAGQPLRVRFRSAHGDVLGAAPRSDGDALARRMKLFQDRMFDIHGGSRGQVGVAAMTATSLAALELADDVGGLLCDESWDWSDGASRTIEGRLAGVPGFRLIPQGPWALVPWTLIGIWRPGGAWGRRFAMELAPTPFRQDCQVAGVQRPDRSSASELFLELSRMESPVVLGHGGFDAHRPEDSELLTLRPLAARLRWSELDDAARAWPTLMPRLGLAACDAAEQSRALLFGDLLRLVTPFQRIARSVICASMPLTEQGAALVQRITESIDGSEPAAEVLRSRVARHLASLEGTTRNEVVARIRAAHFRGVTSPGDLASLAAHSGV